MIPGCKRSCQLYGANETRSAIIAEELREQTGKISRSVAPGVVLSEFRSRGFEWSIERISRV
ncbi:MAG: hypothetical protein DWH78_03125 [Planctomycetota bacterium]|nr:MAG: hypothetical protein DWH78_03125 [Planctomycetota bacterium]